ncbi:copper chaperone [Rhizobium leguminosarum]|uniref:copper chaperone n=1 Tax=Rhizobium TaxID=379 RepID=UPI00103216B5|nr:hypothetical protein ELI31_35385 [Rhizobium leguminosarum]TAV41232.1 hypothetical protein ELI32_35380 [Rhizobium leguminosarum]TAV61097.1 hypothetical protein ELI30_35170 [Rhizobium leguminosarum]TAY61125.1 hypothetical protein ELH82_33070 [Rhizobium leguminosarum]
MRGRLPTTAIAPLLFACIAVSVGYLSLALFAPETQIPTLCGAIGNLTWGDLPLALGPDWSSGALLWGWLLMLAAMMPPLILRPLLAISAARQRSMPFGIFALGYFAAWGIFVIWLVPLTILLIVSFGRPVSVVAILLLALTWSMSPLCQHLRNLCHRGDWTAGATRTKGLGQLIQGCDYAMRCAGICWPWMVLSLCFDTYHLVAMAVISAYLVLDRASPPAVPRWQLPPSLQFALEKSRPQKALGRL